MKTKKDYSKMYSIIFIILCSIGGLIFACCISKQKKLLYSLLSNLFCIAIIKLIEKYFNNNDDNIYSNKKLIVAFCIQFFLIVFFSVYKKNIFEYILLVEIGFSLTIFLCYFFGTKLNDFNWNSSFKSIFFILIIFLVIKVFPLIISKMNSIHMVNIEMSTFFSEFIKATLYPGIFEEVMFRGFLISGLKAYGIKNSNINVIQATLFGILHFSLYLPLGIIGIVGVCYQMLGGYILGKVYFKTKSLTPCILLHGLMDVRIL